MALPAPMMTTFSRMNNLQFRRLRIPRPAVVYLLARNRQATRAMRLQPGFLSRSQVQTIHANALRVLDEVGVRVEHAELRHRLESVGGRTGQDEMLCFRPADVERLIAQAPKTRLSERPPRVGLRVGIYHSRYLDPKTNELLPFNEERLARYIDLARQLNADGIGMLGVPFAVEGLPPGLAPLAEKLYSWKLGCRPDGSIISTDLCEPILEMYRCHAASVGRPLEDAFHAAGYLVSPLRLARLECEQLLFFHRHGLRMYIGHMPSQGGTAPVTFAGALTLTLAERIFIFLLQRCLWPEEPFHIDGTPATMDMRSGLSFYGRPEMQRFNVALADLARFYGCSCAGHTGLTDAKLPSVEAGVQKAAGALITALACGSAAVSGGLLGVDEICSPVQLVLDRDLVDGLKALLIEPQVSDELCALEDIRAVGAGGNFLGTELTVHRFRQELWQSRTWSHHSTSGWSLAGRKIDLDLAREVVAKHDKGFAGQSYITPEEERELWRIARRVSRV